MQDKTQGPKYPEVSVDLSSVDGNAFSVLGACRHAPRRGGVSNYEIKQFSDQAMSGNYDHLLQTCFRWFEIN